MLAEPHFKPPEFTTLFSAAEQYQASQELQKTDQAN